MKIAVIGASRGLGRALVIQAQKRGYQLNTLSRTGRPEGEPLNDQTRWFMGDVTRYKNGAASAATKDCDAVVICLGASRALGAKPHHGQITRQAGTKAVLKAMHENNVERVIVCSAFGVLESKKQLNFLEKLRNRYLRYKMLRDHTMQERTVMNSNSTWTILRPIRLTDVAEGQKLCMNLNRDPQSGVKVSRLDLANWILDHLNDSDTYYQKLVPQVENA